MRSKWDILEWRHWGGWNWLTCSHREGNIKQTPQPTLGVADSPKKGRINTERLKPFWEPRWLVCPSLLVSWQGSNNLVFSMSWCERKWLHSCPLQYVCFWLGLDQDGFLLDNRIYRSWTHKKNQSPVDDPCRRHGDKGAPLFLYCRLVTSDCYMLSSSSSI